MPRVSARSAPEEERLLSGPAQARRSAVGRISPDYTAWTGTRRGARMPQVLLRAYARALRKYGLAVANVSCRRRELNPSSSTTQQAGRA